MLLSDKAYQLIRQRIITLELPPLSPINEKALMDSLDLGRTPIREALQRLASDGLVFSVPHRGIFVSEISITDMERIFEARLVLEGFCARLAAQRATAAQLAAMAETVGHLGSTPNADTAALMAVDEQFHGLLYEAADNKFLADSLQRLHALSFRLWYLVLDRIGDVRGAMEQHVEIAQALQAGDADQAEAVLQQHISQFHQRIKAVV